MHIPLGCAPATGVVLALLAATTAGHRRSPPRPGEAREPAAAQDAVYPAYYGPPLGDACSGLWPLPQLAHCNGTGAVALLRGGFAFVAGTEAARGSERLRRGFARYHDHIFQPRRPHAQAAAQGGLGWRAALPCAALLCAALPQLVVNIADANETLTMGVDESYELDLRAASCQPGLGSAPASAVLSAETVFGALRGLETFSQLTVRTDAGDNSSVFINSTSVVVRDWPRFAWRGIMVDSSRHWLPLPALRTMVDAIAFNRLNVLHWHISDAQSFPLNVSAYPRLVEGAYGGASSALVYSGDQVRGLVAYAKDRGVRVVPELDSPGHSASWQIGYPDIGVQVPGDWYSGMVDPTKNASFQLLSGLFGELASLFEDEFVHIGCDEVDFTALNNTPSVVAYMRRHGIARTDLGFKSLVAAYIERLSAIVRSLGRTPVAWQEAMDHYGNSSANPTPPAAGLPGDLVIQQWLSPVWNWANLSSITGPGPYASTDDPWPEGHRGFRAIVTRGWYLDSTDGEWEAAYAQEPLTNKTCEYSPAFPRGNCTCECPENPWRDGECHCYDLRYSHPDQAARVLGGEACLWGEKTDAAILSLRAFPGAMAVAERLWSALEVQNATAASPRLARQRCRLLERGVDVTPSRPGYCL